MSLCSFALLLQLMLLWVNVSVPVYPLDGGRLAVAALAHLGLGLDAAAFIVAGAGLMSGGLTLLYGLLSSATAFFFGVWVLYEAFCLRRMAAAGEAGSHPLFRMYSPDGAGLGPSGAGEHSQWGGMAHPTGPGLAVVQPGAAPDGAAVYGAL